MTGEQFAEVERKYAPDLIEVAHAVATASFVVIIADGRTRYLNYYEREGIVAALTREEDA